jgi:hypothetical protein
MPASKEELLQPYRDDMAKAEQNLALVGQVIKAMPSETPLPDYIRGGGYCASAYMRFSKAKLAHLLELYPPLPVVDVFSTSSRSAKPVEYLRDSDTAHSHVVPVFPVAFIENGLERRARWWTRLGDVVVESSLEGARVSELEGRLEGFRRDTHHYATGETTVYHRPLVSLNTRRDSMSAWGQQWEDYALELNLSAADRRRLVEVRDAIVAGQTVVMEGAEHAEFVQRQRDSFPEAKENFSVEVGQLKRWFTEFCGQHAPCYSQDSAIISRYVEHKIQEELGVRFKFQKVDFSERSGARVDPIFAVLGEYPRWTFSFRPQPWTQMLRVQDIGVTYAD